ncbi:YpiF family protein [Oceanobacillus halophilus]|uniref:DUF2487 family protein n=1 Tax=Oceanobacillus halophilus TaxID=930130 RepID=A0A495ACQ9_9BACI|nr:YpiF family protein [Oceanobacillus halophilus]RKQ37652.1 DUF2487 family protein [Oceanobacillus halophilus]
MKWRSKDLKQYLQAKEYIDTIMVPLVPFHLSNEQDMEKDSFRNEVLTVFSNEMEKELSGRMMLMPVYNYIKSTDMNVEKDRLNDWVEDIKVQPFKHIFFITFDSKWRKLEQELDGTLIWLPTVQTGDILSKELQSMIREQVKEITEFIRSYW